MERLSGLDASFLYLETNAGHMHVAMTMVIDPADVAGGYSFDKVKDYIADRVHLIPAFHRRLLEVPFNLAHPLWVDDPDFDIDYHVRRTGSPAPGGRRELGLMAAQIASTPLDRSRPLWELWVIEGLKQGRVGVVLKVHHCAVDGASGSELLVHLFDLEPEPPPVPPTPALPGDSHIPSQLELLAYAAVSRARQAMSVPKLLGQTAQSVSNVVAGRRDPDRRTGAAPLTAPRTPWNGPLTPHRGVGFARVSLADVKAIKTTFDCTVNDVVLALCAGTLRHYLEAKGELPDDPLIAVVPVSVKGAADASPNQVSAMFTSLATNISDAGERLLAIAESTKGAKEEHNAIGGEMLQNWAELAQSNLFSLMARWYSSWGLAGSHRPIHNVIISNVAGPTFPLYYAGAQVVAAYPMGPVMEGAGLNITVFSYLGSIDFGFMVGRELIPDVWDMADAVTTALAELQDAADRLATGQPKRAPLRTIADEPQER